MNINIMQKYQNPAFILLLFCFFAVFFSSCKPYKDPAPIITNVLTTHYCNNPKAVNYNWGFPGVADDAICFFPADLFVGQYTYYDSILDVGSSLYLPFDTVDITIAKLTDSTIHILGQCVTVPLSAKASKNYRFALDSTTYLGQVFCGGGDTINGAGTKIQFNDTNFVYQYQLIKNGNLLNHKGWMIKK
jgi:hypothetical protein